MTDAVPADDVSIADTVLLWRRIHPEWYILDENTGGFRITSQAFQNYPETSEMSVCIADECASTEDLLVGHDGFGIAALTAGQCRACDQVVVRAPEPELPAHCHVVGSKGRKQRRCLQKASAIVVEPTQNGS